VQDGPLLKFEGWAPDISAINTNVTSIVSNVIPRSDGYGPFPSFNTLTKSLPGSGLIVSVGSLVGGSGYTNGSYTNVPLTGGTGHGAAANITVAGGAVTVVTIINPGAGYTVSDVLTSIAFGPGSGFSVTVTAVRSPSPTCRGGIFARNLDGSITVFAATATDLYELNNTDFSWTNVSKAGGPYTAVVNADNWQFVQYNNVVFATQVNTILQKFTLGLDTAFSDQSFNPPLGPPQASHIAIINGFVVLTGIISNPSLVQWCDLNNPQEWNPGVGQADNQQLPDGGVVHDIRGGDQYGIIFQDASIRSMVYNPGSAVVFNILRISTQDGIFGQYSSVTAGDKIFFCSPQGFKKIESGGYPTPIGKERIDRTFFADVDSSALQLFLAATDPTSTRVYWMYKSQSGSIGLADKILVYDWALDQWTIIIGQALEFLMYLTKPGLTLEGLDAIAPGIITITAAANNGSGNIRLTLSPGLTAGTPPSNTNLNVENTVEIYNGTGGVPNVNTPFTIFDSTHIDLPIAFTTTGTGSIGGSVDQLAFSLDSFGAAPLAQFAAFNSGHMLGTFSGANLEGIIETPDNDLGERYAILWLRPMTDAVNCFGSLGVRDTAQATVIYTGEQAITPQGLIPARIETRYARGRLRVPASMVWTYAMGMKAPDAQPGQGDR
jgi:hypothetical protein